MPLFRRDESDDRDDSTDPTVPNDRSSDRGGETYSDGDGDRGRRRSSADTTVVDGHPQGTGKRAVDREAGVVVDACKNGSTDGLVAVPVSQTGLTLETDRGHGDV